MLCIWLRGLQHPPGATTHSRSAAMLVSAHETLVETWDASANHNCGHREVGAMKQIVITIPCALAILGLLSTDVRSSSSRLVGSDLQLALGACEATGTLKAVYCQKAAVNCVNTTWNGPPDTTCGNQAWQTACVGVEGATVNGSGTSTLTTSNCEFNYSSGACMDGTVKNTCTQSLALTTTLTCGTITDAGSC
jgi:hypothetical protein